MVPFLRYIVRASLVSCGLLLAGQAGAAVTLSIEMNPNPVRAGEVVIAELTVANNGGSAVNTVTLQATVPGNMNSFNASLMTGGGTCTVVINNGICDSTEVMNWNLGTIPAGKAVTVSVAMTVAAATAAGTTLTLPGTVLVNAVTTASASAQVVVSTSNALSLAVDEDKDAVVTGDTLTYTLTYGNRAASTSVTGTTLSFPLPAGTTFVSATGGGTFSAGSVTWSLGTIPATQSGSQRVVVSVNNGLAAGTVMAVDAAVISGSSGVAETASATAVTRVAASPPLVVGVELNPNPVRSGERGVIQLTVSNRGGAPLTGVVLQARIGQAVDAFNSSYVTGGATCIVAINNGVCDATERLNWNLGTVPAGGGVTLSLPLFVTAGTAGGRIIVLETLANDDAGNQAVLGASAAVDTDAPLSLSVDEDKSPVPTGDQLTYTLTYGNRATSSSITGTTLSFPIPEGTTFVSATGGGTLSGGSVQWSLGSLPATQSGVQQVVVTVNGGLAAGTKLLANGAMISGLNSSLITESAWATAVTRVAASPPLVVGVEFNPSPIRAGERGLAQVTVSNRGAQALTGVVLQARVPQASDSFTAAYLTGGATCIVGFNNGLCDSSELMNWTLGTIPAGRGVTLSVPVFSSAGTAGGRLMLLETLANDDGSNRSASETAMTVDTDAPLSLSLDEDRNPVATGDLLTYTLTYGNRATSSSITGTTLSFPVPAGTTFVSATGGGTLSGGSVQWGLGSMASTQSGEQQVVVSVDGGVAAGSVLAVNGASISGLNSSLVTELARATATTRVQAAPALVIGMEVNPDPVRPGERGSALLTVSNRGGAPLTGVVLEARMPQGTDSFTAAYLTGGGACVIAVNNGVCDALERMDWDLGTIPAGAGVTLPVPVFASAGSAAGRLFVLEALARDDGSNNAALQTAAAFDTDNPLTLAVNDSTDAVPGGGIVQYTLTYGNRATSGSTTGTTLSFPLPVETVLLGSTGGTIIDGNVVWNLGSLAAGAGGRRVVTLSVPGAVTAGSLVRINSAQIKGNIVAGVVPENQRAMAVTRVEASKPIGLSLVLSPDPVLATQTLTSTITVTNNSGSTLTGLVVQARVPWPGNSFTPANLTGGGSCIVGVNNGLCDSSELANWNIGTLLNGAQAIVTMPMVVTAGTVNGRLITVEARVTDDSGKLSTMERTVLLNPFTDTDGDTVAQIFDNCTTLANANQCDSDNDGYGNRCDGDLGQPAPGNGFTNGQDVTLFRLQVGLPSVAPVYNAADLNCNGFVNGQDYTLLRQLIGLPPGPSALAP